MPFYPKNFSGHLTLEIYLKHSRLSLLTFRMVTRRLYCLHLIQIWNRQMVYKLDKFFQIKLARLTDIKERYDINCYGQLPYNLAQFFSLPCPKCTDGRLWMDASHGIFRISTTDLFYFYNIFKTVRTNVYAQFLLNCLSLRLEDNDLIFVWVCWMLLNKLFCYRFVYKRF